jgi:uncharacterized protein YcbK (DUF882 family)
MADKLLTASEKTPGAPQGVRNFKYSEMEYYDRIPAELIPNADKVLQNLQVLRDACGKPITIISGYRSISRNEAVGGAKKSQHMEGNACDIKVKDMAPKDVAKLIEKLIAEGKMVEGGLGVYPDFVHTDVRQDASGKPIRARWQG